MKGLQVFWIVIVASASSLQSCKTIATDSQARASGDAAQGVQASPTGQFIGCYPSVGEGCGYACSRPGLGFGVLGGANCATDELACYCPDADGRMGTVPPNFTWRQCERSPAECKRLCSPEALFFRIEPDTCTDSLLPYACYCASDETPASL